MNNKIKFIISICLLLFSYPSIAQTTSERRIEEGKRKQLAPSEVHSGKTAAPADTEIDKVDQSYLNQLAYRKLTYRYDLFKTITLLKGVEMQYFDLNAQILYIQEHKLAPPKVLANPSPNLPLRKGLLAYAIYKALGLKGGLTNIIFGTSRYYAIKELSYHGIMSSGNINDVVSGEELLATISQASNYIARQNQ